MTRNHRRDERALATALAELVGRLSNPALALAEVLSSASGAGHGTASRAALIGYRPSATSAAHRSGSSYQAKRPPGVVTKRAVGILSTLGLPAAGARNRSSSGQTKRSGTVKLASSASVRMCSGRGVR